MSLINEVLRNLDERRASAIERTGVASQVRALPPERRFPWARILSVLAGAAIGAAGLWLVIDGQRPVAVPVPPSAPVAPVAAEAAPEPPAAGLPPLVVQLPSETSAEGPADTPPVPDPERTAALQLDFRLSTPAAAALPLSRAAGPASARNPVEPAAAEGAAIDRRPRTTAATDAAENDFRKAMGLVRQGATVEAMAGFQAALRSDGRHVQARQALLSLLVEQRRWPEAQALAAEGLALDPAQPGWAMAMARLQVEQGQLAEAEATMARHGQYGERNADYQAFHAVLLQKSQRPKEAVERFRAAVALRPGEGRWWYGLGAALEMDQRPGEAREAFLKARDAGNLSAELAALIEPRLR